jgi:hypothetical protein
MGNKHDRHIHIIIDVLKKKARERHNTDKVLPLNNSWKSSHVYCSTMREHYLNYTLPGETTSRGVFASEEEMNKHIEEVVHEIEK